MILRLPMHVSLFDNQGVEVKRFSSSKKSQIRLKVSDFPRTQWAYGTCRVWYSKPGDYWNEFRFMNKAQLEDGLTTNTEKPLIDFLKDLIPLQYLEKRKLSVAQRSAIRRARVKSTMRAGV
jgi:hypothetical protein